MILIINGTNRPNNKTQIFSEFLFNHLSKTTNEEVKYLNLEQLTDELSISTMYAEDQHSSNLVKIHEEYIFPSTKWIILAPEYNGSYPGILKLFIDAISMRKYGVTFNGKKVGLIGTSSGRAGNLRGLEHMTSFLNYLKITVFHNKLPISSLSSILNSEGEINKETQEVLETFATDFIKWCKS